MGMHSYELPMQENGRIILPVELRRTLALKKGDRVLLMVDGDTITLTTPALRRRQAQEIAARYAVAGVSVVDEYLGEKREDADRENAPDSPSADASAA